ncbi:hypothetical protein DIPPA_27473 [Diplonema papillatum]|nr:hypothetical protein DIPPA_27473 [Diplonema papillatum]
MLRLIAALTLVPWGLATTCLSEESLAVCFTLGDDWLLNATEACFSGMTPDQESGVAETSTMSLSLQTGILQKDIYSVVPHLVVATCDGTAVVFTLQTALVPSESGLPEYVSSISVDANFRLTDAPSLEWQGDIVNGMLDSIFVEFALHKDAYDTDANLVVGLITPPALTSPALPPVLKFTGDAIALLTHADTCPFTSLVPETVGYSGPVLEIVEVATPFPILHAYFDPCLARRVSDRNCTEDPTACTALNRDVVVTLSASTGSSNATAMFAGMDIEAVTVSLQGTFIWQGTELADTSGAGTGQVAENGIRWNGSVSANVKLFDDLYAFGTAPYSPDGFSSLEVAISYNTSLAQVQGTAVLSTACTDTTTPHNVGDVNVVLKALNASFEAKAMQTRCNEWQITGEVLGKKLSLFGVSLQSSFVNMSLKDVNETLSLRGSVVGVAAIDSWVTATGTIAIVDGAVASFEAIGTIDNDILTGDISFVVDAAKDVLIGEGDLSLSFSNGDIPQLSATVELAKSPLAHPLWTVKGSLASWTLYGIEVKDVEVYLTASTEIVNATSGSASSLLWSGVVSGSLILEGKEVAVNVTVADNAFQSIVGVLQVEGPHVFFDGVFELDDMSKHTGCEGLVYSAHGNLELAGYEFGADVVSNGCSNPAIGEALFTFSATVDGGATLHYSSVTLTKAVVELYAYGDICTDTCDATDLLGAGASRKIKSWSGVLSGNSNLFGGTSTASVSFANGELSDLYVSTFFRTDSQLISGSLEVLYSSDCAKMSEGTADVKVRLQNAQTLNVSGDIGYDTCTGRLDFSGKLVGKWESPFVTAKEVTLGLSLPAEPALISSGVGKRFWYGEMVIVPEDVQQASLTLKFNSSSSTSVVGELAYNHENVVVNAALQFSSGGACVGDGTVFIEKLPYGIPSFETEVSVQMNTCTDESAGWSLSGKVSSFVLPFHSKTMNLTSVKISVSRFSANDTVYVTVTGAYAKHYYVEVEFDTAPGSSVRVTGGLLSSTPSVSSFLTAWTGGTPALPASLGAGAPELYSGIRGFALRTVFLDFLYDDRQVTLVGSGVLYGLGFDAIVVIKRVSGGWAYGIKLTTQDTDAPQPSGLTPFLENIVTQLSPNRLMFSLASPFLQDEGLAVVSRDGTTAHIRKGLELEMYLGSNSEVMEQVASASPADLKLQIDEAKDSASGITVIAKLTSRTKANVFAMLRGNMELGTDRVKLTTLALNFRFESETGKPQIGFLSTVWFRLGSVPYEEEFSATGFIQLDATGNLTLDLSVTSPTPWIDAFGVSGVDVQFPLAVHLGTSSSMKPSAFALSGPALVGGAQGTIVLSANTADFGETAFAAKVDNVNLKHIVTELTGCSDCVRGIAETLTSVSIKKATVTAYHGSSGSTTFPVGGETTTIPVGVVASAQMINLWNVITIARADFVITSAGTDGYFEAAPIQWGPILITSTQNATVGPTVEFALSGANQSIVVDGMATIWGVSVSVVLEFTDKLKQGHFNLDLGGFATLDAEILMEGTPGSAEFANIIDGELKVEPVELVKDATQWLVDLQEKATTVHETVKTGLDTASEVLSTANTMLDSLEAHWQNVMASWERKVASLDVRITALTLTCKKHEEKCDGPPFTSCLQLGWCRTKQSLMGAMKVGTTSLIAALKAMSRVPVSLARTAVNAALAVVETAEDALAKSWSVVSGFMQLAEIAGGNLTNTLDFERIGFTSALSPTVSEVTFTGEVKILGREITWDFTSNLTYDGITSAVANEVRESLRTSWGGLISAL